MGLIPSRFVNGIGGYVLKDYRTDSPIGTITSSGDFIPAYPKSSQSITSRQGVLNIPGRGFQDGQDAPAPPAYRLGGSRAADAFSMVSDTKGGQVRRGEVNW